MAAEAYRGHAYTESQSTEDLDGFDGVPFGLCISLKLATFARLR